MKMRARCSSETLVDFQWTIYRYITEDKTRHVTYTLLNLLSFGIKNYKTWRNQRRK
jgi:hypothetical protein